MAYFAVNQLWGSRASVALFRGSRKAVCSQSRVLFARFGVKLVGMEHPCLFFLPTWPGRFFAVHAAQRIGAK